LGSAIAEYEFLKRSLKHEREKLSTIFPNMADRRPRADGPKGSKPEGVKKQRKGISVGRALPDGPQKRKGISCF